MSNHRTALIGFTTIFLLSSIIALSFLPQSEAEVEGLSYTTVHPINGTYVAGTFDTWIENPDTVDKGTAVQESGDGQTIVRESNSKWQTFVFKNATDANSVSDGPAISANADIQSLIIKANVTNTGDSKDGKVLVGCEVGNKNPSIFKGPTETIASGETRVIEFDYGSTNPATGAQWVTGDVDDWINIEGEQFACGVLNQDKQKSAPMEIDEIWIRIGTADTEPPTGSVVINNDDAGTVSTDATLTVICDDNGGSGCSHIDIFYDDVATSTVDPFLDGERNVTTTLPSDRGVKTVIVQLVDENNNAANVTDSIELFAIIDEPAIADNITPLWGIEAVGLSGGELNNTLSSDQILIQGDTPNTSISPNSTVAITAGAWSGSLTYEKESVTTNSHLITWTLVDASNSTVLGVDGQPISATAAVASPLLPIDVEKHQLGLEIPSLIPTNPLAGHLVTESIRVVDLDMEDGDGIHPGVDGIAITIGGDGALDWLDATSNPLIINDTNNLITVSDEVMNLNIGSEIHSNLDLHYFYFVLGPNVGNVTVSTYSNGVFTGNFTSAEAPDDDEVVNVLGGYVDEGGLGVTKFVFTGNDGPTPSIGLFSIVGYNEYETELVSLDVGMLDLGAGTHHFETNSGVAYSGGLAPDWDDQIGQEEFTVETTALGNDYYFGSETTVLNYLTRDPLDSLAAFGGGLPVTPDSGTGIKSVTCGSDSDKDLICNTWETRGSFPYKVDGTKYFYIIDPAPVAGTPDIYYEIDAMDDHAPRSLTIGAVGAGNNIMSAFATGDGSTAPNNMYNLHLIQDEVGKAGTPPALAHNSFTNTWRDNDLTRDNDFDNIKADHYGTPDERAHIKDIQNLSFSPGGSASSHTITIEDVEILSTPTYSNLNVGGAAVNDHTDGTITVRVHVELGGSAEIDQDPSGNYKVSISAPSANPAAGITKVNKLASSTSLPNPDVDKLSPGIYEISAKIRFVTDQPISNVQIGDIGLSIDLTTSATLSATNAPITPAITTTLQDARAQIYRYMVYVHDTGGASGHGERLGNDIVISLGNGFGGSAAGHTGSIGTPKQEAGTTMHEIGHNLNLLHGGPYSLVSGPSAGIPISDSSINCKPNYPSVMSYGKQMPAGLAGNWAPEFSYGQHSEIDEGNLDDDKLVTVSSHGRQIKWGDGSGAKLTDNSFNPIDWNDNGSTNDSGATQDVNYLGFAGCNTPKIDTQTFFDHNDWLNLNLKFSLTPSGTFDAIHGESEAEVNSDQAIQAAMDVASFADVVSPLSIGGDTFGVNRNQIPIKFDLPASDGSESVSNLGTVLELRYIVLSSPGDPDSPTIDSGVISNCEYESDKPHYHCPFNPNGQVGTYYFDIFIVDPVEPTNAALEIGPLITTDNKLLKDVKHLNGPDAHHHSFWFTVE